MIKLELDLKNVNIILAALSKQPLEAVLETFNLVQQQATGQLEHEKPSGPLANKVV